MRTKEKDRVGAELENQPFMAATPVRPAQLAAFHVNPPPTPQPVDAARANKPKLLWRRKKMRELAHPS